MDNGSGQQWLITLGYSSEVVVTIVAMVVIVVIKMTMMLEDDVHEGNGVGSYSRGLRGSSSNGDGSNGNNGGESYQWVEINIDNGDFCSLL